MRTVRSKTLANAMDQKTRSNRALGKQNREQLSEESRFKKQGNRRKSDGNGCLEAGKTGTFVCLLWIRGIDRTSHGCCAGSRKGSFSSLRFWAIRWSFSELQTEQSLRPATSIFWSRPDRQSAFAGCFDSDAFDRSRTCL